VAFLYLQSRDYISITEMLETLGRPTYTSGDAAVSNALPPEANIQGRIPHAEHSRCRSSIVLLDRVPADLLSEGIGGMEEGDLVWRGDSHGKKEG